MALNPQQQTWFNGYIDHVQQIGMPPREANLTPGADVATHRREQQQHTERLAAYRANPVTQARYLVLRSMGVSNPETFNVRTGMNPDQQRLYDDDVRLAVEAMRNPTDAGNSFLENLRGAIQPPSIQQVASNPFSFLNPMSWLASLGTMFERVPVFRQLKLAAVELFNGYQQHGVDIPRAWKRAGLQMDLDARFSAIPAGPQRDAVIANAMTDYTQYGNGQTRPPLQTQTGGNNNVPPSNGGPAPSIALQGAVPLGGVTSGNDALTYIHSAITSMPGHNATLDDSIMSINLPRNSQHSLVRFPNGDIGIVSGNQEGQNIRPTYLTRINLETGAISATQSLPPNSPAIPLLTPQQQAQQAAALIGGLGMGLATQQMPLAPPVLPYLMPTPGNQR